MQLLQWLNDNAPAVQAVGTLFAIGIAILVPFTIHRNEMRKKEQEVLLKGQALAILIDPLLQAMRIAIETDKIVIERG